MINLSRCLSESEIVNFFYENPKFKSLFYKKSFSSNFKKVLTLTMQQTFDREILDLCDSYVDMRNECLSEQVSTELMLDWCKHQGIDPKQFAQDIIDVMDHRQRGKKHNLPMRCTQLG